MVRRPRCNVNIGAFVFGLTYNMAFENLGFARRKNEVDAIRQIIFRGIKTIYAVLHERTP